MIRQLLVSNRFAPAIDEKRIAEAGASLIGTTNPRRDGTVIVEVAVDPPATDVLRRLEAMLGAHGTDHVDHLRDSGDRLVRVVTGVTDAAHRHFSRVAMTRGTALGVILGDVLDDQVPAIGDRIDPRRLRDGLIDQPFTHWVSAPVTADIARSLAAWAFESSADQAALGAALIEDAYGAPTDRGMLRTPWSLARSE